MLDVLCGVVCIGNAHALAMRRPDARVLTAQAWQQFMEAMHGNAAASRMLEKAAQEEAAAALNVRRSSAMDDLLSAEHLDGAGASAGPRGGVGSDSPSTGRSDSPDVTLGKAHVPGTTPYTPDVKLWHRAVVVHQENSLRGLVRQLSIDQLDNEGRRVSIYENGGGGPPKEKSPLFTRSMSVSVSSQPHAGLHAACVWRVLSSPACPVMGPPVQSSLCGLQAAQAGNTAGLDRSGPASAAAPAALHPLAAPATSYRRPAP
jgi:hypothetical protein